MIAEYMNFYGASFVDVMGMPSNWFFILYRKIHVVESRRILALIDATAFPHVDEKARHMIHERLLENSGYKEMRTVQPEEDKYHTGWTMLRKFSGKDKK